MLDLEGNKTLAKILFADGHDKEDFLKCSCEPLLLLKDKLQLVTISPV